MRAAAACLLLGALLTGCRTPNGSAASAPATEAAGTEAAATSPWRVLGTSVEGRPISVASFGSGARAVLVLATIHGDESAGTPLCEELVRRLEGAPAWAAARRVLVLAVCNPDGLARGTRRNAAGVDLNRDFPAANHRDPSRVAPTQPESRLVQELVEEEGVVRILSFHQAARQVDWDGPAEELARSMAAVSPLPPERMGARPGSLGSWAGVDRRIEVVTIELERADDGREALELWSRYGELVRVGISHPLPTDQETGAP